ncbi:MAG: hypothetical protein SynsKO_42350 [Synoicihabitans sp.]
MDKWSLSNLEIVNVPNDLSGYAHGIMFEILGYIKGQKAVAEDENMGGCFVSDEQIVVHKCTFRRSIQEDEPVDKDFLRIVDFEQPLDSGFPRKLFAAHLFSLASEERNPLKQIDLLEKSVRIYPGEENPSLIDEDSGADNPGNFFSWELLGNAYLDIGEETKGLETLNTAYKKWPYGMSKNAEVIAGEIRKGNLPSPEDDSRARFWIDIYNRKKVEQGSGGNG